MYGVQRDALAQHRMGASVGHSGVIIGVGRHMKILHQKHVFVECLESLSIEVFVDQMNIALRIPKYHERCATRGAGDVDLLQVWVRRVGRQSFLLHEGHVVEAAQAHSKRVRSREPDRISAHSPKINSVSQLGRTGRASIEASLLSPCTVYQPRKGTPVLQ
jgi:hypothetical protein